MSRISTKLHKLAAEGRKAMGLFLTNGYPDLASTLPLLRTLEAGGADFIELGMPFSDPIAEGLPIQHSSARALAGGVQMEDAFRTAEAFRKESALPLLLMGYINPILQYGVHNFCAAAHSSGIDGLIIPDLPPQEAEMLKASAREHQLDTVFLLAPNTPDDRAKEIDRLSDGFVYAVSVTGITGAALEHRVDAVGNYLERVKRLVQKNPLIVGFGIKSRKDAVQLCHHADGFVVGSALVHIIEGLWTNSTLSTSQRLLSVQRFAQNLMPLPQK